MFIFLEKEFIFKSYNPMISAILSFTELFFDNIFTRHFPRYFGILFFNIIVAYIYL